MKINKGIIGVILLSFVGTLIIYPYLPNQIPVHWGIDGTIEKTNKGVSFLTALIPFVIYLLKVYVSKFDPKNINNKRHQKAFEMTILTITFFLIAVHWVVLFYSFGMKVNVPIIIKLLVGIMMMVVSHYLSQIKPNFFIGIRTPWTLGSEDVWEKTHKVAGYVFFLVGIIISICAFFNDYISTIIIFCLLILSICYVTLFSYWEIKKSLLDKNKKKNYR